MFESIRNHKKYLMGFLMILIIPSFVLFGVQGFSDGSGRGKTVATVNGEDITQQEWDQAHQVESQRLRESMPTLDAKFLDTDEARYATLERLVRERVLAVAAQKLNLYTSDQRLARDLQQNEAIASLRRPDGTLDTEAYRQLVGRQGMTPEMFEARVRADISVRQVSQGIVGSGFASPAIAKPSLNAFFEQREVRVVRFAAADFAARVKPSDAEIETFYNDNPQLFQAPEQVDIEYLVLDTEELQKTVSLNEADVRAFYDQNASRLSGNEERRASHILLTVPPGASASDKAAVRDRAAALLAQVRQAPDTFAAVATANSQDPGSAANGGDLDFFARGAMVKPFEDTVFALKKGDISDLVETEFGFHIIRVTDIKAPEVKSFESMRAQIETDLKKQQAQKLFAENAEAFSNLVYEQGDSLAPTAERLKLTVQTAQGVTRQGQPGSAVLSSDRLLSEIFSAESVEKKRNVAAVEVRSGQLASARVLQYLPARTRPLAEVRDAVRSQLVAQRSAQLAQEEGAQKLAAWQAAPASANLPAALTVSREKAQDLPGAVLNAALSADPAKLPVWKGVNLGNQGYAVIQVEKVLPREARDAQAQQQEVQQYGQWWSAAEGQAYYETLKERFKVRIEVPAPQSMSTAAR
ncbi:SurA N-terminal domain-containing protein [Hydrogenophaga sp.]|uniref:SurA N-terminal domain-containing protein n=1 Tax=Hydrogenophaga sp. TaxID=1904254 RepID=UPI0025C343DD|nr:SurA N-terminal domain-containing protein [Hydrogenophaga sp.]